MRPKSNLSRNLTRIREDKGWSRLELAEKSGEPLSMIIAIEVNGVRPTMSMMRAFAKALDVKVDELSR